MRFPDLSKAIGDTLWAVIGAAATRAYMPERLTGDLDIAVAASDAPEVSRRLRAAGCEQLGPPAIGGSAWRTPEGFPVEVIELDDPWARDALREAQTQGDAQGLPVMPLRYLVLLKLRSSRAQDVADISRMLGQADEPALDAVRRVIAEQMPDAIEDVESLIALGKLELS